MGPPGHFASATCCKPKRDNKRKKIETNVFHVFLLGNCSALVAKLGFATYSERLLDSAVIGNVLT